MTWSDGGAGRAAPAAALLAFAVGALLAPPAVWAQTLIRAVPSFVSVPTPATSAGVVYRYDAKTATFVRESEVAGQIYIERPATIGSARWNLSTSYQWFDFGTEPFTTNKVRDGRISTTVHELATSITYGVTDRLDVNLTVPVLYVDSDVSRAGDANGRHTDLTIDPIFLRFKYSLVDRPALELAAGLVVRLSTLTLFDSPALAIGRVQPGLHFYGSRERLPVGWGMYVKPYVTLGAAGDETGTESVEAKWGAGIDLSVSDRVTAAVAMLGYHRPFDSKEAAVFQLYNASFGARVALWQDRLIGFVNLLVPINRSASPLVPLAGLEITL